MYFLSHFYLRFLVNLPQHFKFLLKVKPSFDK